MKRGFTLLELLIASAISVLILTGAAVAFASSVRLLRLAMAESELSLASRQLRDRLLFYLEPPSASAHVPGLLSGTERADARLALEEGRLVNERAIDRARSAAWLAPGGFRLVETSLDEVVTVEEALANEPQLLTLDLTLRATSAGVELTRPMRVHVPVFGKEQMK